MSEAKPTPGPWRAIRTQQPDCWHIQQDHDGLQGMGIADVWGQDSKADEANARFIVQACNSHDELLEAANRVLHEVFLNSGAPDSEARTTEALSLLAEAAAKAEGRE